MSVTNDFVPFCYQDTGTNLEEQADYLVDPQRTIGNQPGIASSQLVNKALRQGTAVVSQLAQYVSNYANVSTIDNAVEQQLLSQIMGAFQPLAPVLTQLLTGTGTWNATFCFFCAPANATAGATYTNNGVTYTITNTIASGLILKGTGNGAPTANGGTLTKASGTGDSSIIFYAYRQALHLEVEMVGAGGGGLGGGRSAVGSAGNGTDTTFGSSFLDAGGGFGAPSLQGGNGGAVTLPGSGFTGIGLNGAVGGPSHQASNTDVNLVAGNGGSSPFGGAGAGDSAVEAGGFSATPNTGSGGGGGNVTVSTGITSSSGAGGGAGAYIKGIIYAPLAFYAYSIGVGGAGGTPGTGGTAGGTGGSGLILVKEIFQ